MYCSINVCFSKLIGNVGEIITPCWQRLDTLSIKENLGGSAPQALDIYKKMAMEEEEEGYFTNRIFEKRHSSGEAMEKWGFSNFITRRNHKKRTHHQSLNSSKSSGSGGVHFGFPTPAGDDPTVVSPTTKCTSNLMMLQEILPWQQRAFTLSNKDEYDL